MVEVATSSESVSRVRLGEATRAQSPFLDLGLQRFSVILADPPWNFQTYSAKGRDRNADKHYACMGLEDIKSLPVVDLAANNAVLFLWVSNPQLKDGLEVMEAWGFEYKTVAFTWVKTSKSGGFPIGCGYWTRANPELCLLATRGKPKRVSAAVRQLVRSPRREHSRKPDRVRDDIVQLMGDVPRIELFARSRAPGWEAWGNETDFFSSGEEQLAAAACHSGNNWQASLHAGCPSTPSPAPGS
jgi:N6-adenosine-specific RNA methylase IME4